MTDHPTLHPIIYRRPAPDSWRPAGIEPLDGWVNVRIHSHDHTRGVDLYTVEPCPGILYEESHTTEIVKAMTVNGELFNEYGEMHDRNPVIVSTEPADPPGVMSHYVAPDWRPAYSGGGYLGSCPADRVAELLADNGFADAIPRTDEAPR